MLHLILAVRGLFISILILLFAPFIARWFNAPDAILAYQFLAILPVAKSFIHLELKRSHRDLNYKIDVGTQLCSQVFSFLTVVIFLEYGFGFWVMLYGIIVQITTQLFLSHLLTKRRYVFYWDRAMVGDIFCFSWPLALNGLILVVATQGDRILVGGRLSVTDLAIYGSAALISTAMAELLDRVFGQLGLPWVSKVATDPRQHVFRARQFGAIIIGIVVAVLMPFGLLGDELIALLFGEPYRCEPLLAAFLAVGIGFRFARVWTNVIVLSLGDTKILLLGNIFRSAGFALAFAALELGMGMVGVAAAMAIGEIISTILNNYYVYRRYGITPKLHLFIIFSFSSILVFCAVSEIPIYILSIGVGFFMVSGTLVPRLIEPSTGYLYRSAFGVLRRICGMR